MKRIATLAALWLPILVTEPARADTPDPALGFLVGAVTMLAGFVGGGVLLGTSGDSGFQSNAGWLAIQGGFVLAPLIAHAAVGEWGRGAALSAIPAGAFAGSAGLFEYAPNAVLHGTLEQQRAIWVLFGVGLFGSAAGVVDVAFAADRARAIYVTPLVSLASPGSHNGATGLAIGGTL